MALLDKSHENASTGSDDSRKRAEGELLGLYPDKFESFTGGDLDLDGFFAAVGGDSFSPFTSAPAALGPTAEAPLTVALDAGIPSDLSSHLSPDSGIAGGEGQSESPEAPPTFFQDDTHSTINIASYLEDEFQREESIFAVSASLNTLQNKTHMMNNPSLWAPNLPSSNIHAAPGEHPYLHEHSFATAQQCLNPEENNIDTCTAFNSYVEAKHWREKVSRVELDEDPTLPHSTEQEKAMVKVLFKAFKSIDGAVDNEAMVRPFRAMIHENARVEVVCWQILKACITRSKYGSLVTIYDPSKTKPANNIRTFADRFDHIVNAIYSQKTICKHLFDPPFVNTFVDDPVRAKSRVESNRALNEKKGRTMAAGKAATSQSPSKKRRMTSPPKTTSEVPSDVADDARTLFTSPTPLRSVSHSQRPLMAHSTSFSGPTCQPFLPSSPSTFGPLSNYSTSTMPMGATGSSYPQTGQLSQNSAFMNHSRGTYYPHLAGVSANPSNIRAVSRSYTSDGSFMSNSMFRPFQASNMPNLNQTYTPDVQPSVSSSYQSGFSLSPPTSHPTQAAQDAPKAADAKDSALPHCSPLENVIESGDEGNESDHSEYIDGPPKKRSRSG